MVIEILNEQYKTIDGLKHENFAARVQMSTMEGKTIQ